MAKVDAVAPECSELAKKYEIQGFPTLKYFPSAEASPVDYNGGESRTI